MSKSGFFVQSGLVYKQAAGLQTNWLAGFDKLYQNMSHVIPTCFKTGQTVYAMSQGLEIRVQHTINFLALQVICAAVPPRHFCIT